MEASGRAKDLFTAIELCVKDLASHLEANTAKQISRRPERTRQVQR